MSTKVKSRPELRMPDVSFTRLESVRLIEGCVTHAVDAAAAAGNTFLQYLLAMAELEVARMLEDDFGEKPRKTSPSQKRKK